MKTISYIKKLQDKVNNINKDLPNIESKVNSNNTIINNVANKISNINVPLSNLPNKADAQTIQDKINKLIEIKITNANPNEQIIAICGDKSIQTQADNTGIGYLNPTKYGDWSINGKLLSVTSARQYELNILPPKVPLSIMSWNDIARVSESGKASEYWKIGDEKDIQVGSETLTFQIYDFNHDDLADGSGKAGITLGMKNLMNLYEHGVGKGMETTDTNANSFIGSEMYKWLNEECFYNLPRELNSSIKPLIKSVNKKTSAGNQSTSIRTDAMRLWLFSENEVGLNQYSVSGEGTKYPIFTDNNSRIKTLRIGNHEISNYWWLRSPHVNNSDSFCAVNEDGAAGAGLASNLDYGVCFGFCI